MKKKKMHLTVSVRMLSCLILLNTGIVPGWAQEIKLPPDPGYKNNQTLHGIDSNNNNVRDDVEIFIWKEITKDYKTYMAYLKLAESKLEMLKFENDIKKLAGLMVQVYQDISCLGQYDRNEKMTKMNKLSDQIYNTKKRKKVIQEISKKHNKFAEPVPYYSKEEALKLCRF